MNHTTRRLVAPSFVMLLLAGSAIAAPAKKPAEISPERELLITHPAVVDSEKAQYPGAWSFGVLVEQLVRKEKAAEAILHWLHCYRWDSQPGVSSGLPPTTAQLWPWLNRQMPGSLLAMSNHGGENVQRIPARWAIYDSIIKPWMARDRFDAKSGTAWVPNLANAPFRLLAIVNRIDISAPELVNTEEQLENLWKIRGREREFTRMRELATGQSADSRVATRPARFSYYGPASSDFTGPTGGAEGRFIFGAVDEMGRPLKGGWTLIFEYKLPLGLVKSGIVERMEQKEQDVTALRLWAEEWHRLAQLELGDHRYNEELERLTKRFTHRVPEIQGPALEGRFAVAAAPESRPKFSTIELAPLTAGGPLPFGQLRSSEAAFGLGREFRQFNLDNKEGRFVPGVLPMTPAPQYLANTREGGQMLSSLLRSISPLILKGIHTLPANLSDRGKSRPLLASRAIIPSGETDFHWEPKPQLQREARRLFSMSTCNGCHAADTGCPDGLHVHPRAQGEASKLSSFLRTDGKPNRFQDPGLKSMWVQQREMEDRATILAAFLEPKESRRLEAIVGTLKERLRRGH